MRSISNVQLSAPYYRSEALDIRGRMPKKYKYTRSHPRRLEPLKAKVVADYSSLPTMDELGLHNEPKVKLRPDKFYFPKSHRIIF